MKTLSALSGKTLTLEHDSFFKRHYSLISKNEVIGTLKISGAFKITAEADMFDKKWELRYLTLWHTKIGIFQYGYELPFASYKAKWSGGGLVELPKGETIQLNHRMWKGIFEAVTLSGKILFSSARKISLKEKIVFTLYENDELLDENLWLLMLAAFIAVTQKSGAHYH